MKTYKISIVIAFCFFASALIAQTETAAPVKKHKFSFYAGVGPNFYFNNLVLAKDYVNELNYSFAGRLMWEPEHLLSLGIESGYNKLYKVENKNISNAKISNALIPIQLVVCMKLSKAFYFNFSSGQSILLNKVTNSAIGDINSSVLSLGDFSGAIGYRKKIKDRISLGVESKYYYSSKLNDQNVSLLFMGGFSF